MINNLFKNIEKTLCTLAKVAFYLSLVAVVAGVIIFISGLAEGSRFGEMIAMSGIGVSAAGIAGAIGSFPIYGFGILIGEVKKIRTTVCKPKIASSDMPEL